MNTSNLDLLITPQTQDKESYSWGVVTALTPGTVALDGFPDNPIYISDTLRRIEIGDRVYVQLRGTRAIIMGSEPTTENSPTLADVHTQIPAHVTDLTLVSEGYWYGESARSQITVTFTGIDRDTDGNPVPVDHYEITCDGYLYNTTDTRYIIQGLRPSITVTVTVVAVTAEGGRSIPITDTIVTEEPAGRLDQPTQLTVTVNTGIVTIKWDGLLYNIDTGETSEPPQHFDHIRIEESPDNTTWSFVDRTNAISVLDRQDHVGQTLYYRAIAVDTLGHESEPSTVSEVRVVNILLEQVNNALAIAHDALDKADMEGGAGADRLNQAMSELEHLRDVTIPDIQSTLTGVEANVDDAVAQAADASARVTQAQAQVNEAIQAIEDATENIASLGTQLALNTNQLGDLDAQLEDTTARVTTAQQSISSLSSKVTTTASDVKALALAAGMLEPGNLVWNPRFKENAVGWGVPANATRTGVHSTGGFKNAYVTYRWKASDATYRDNIYNGYNVPERMIPTSQGRAYRISIRVRCAQELPAGALRMWMFGGTITTSPYIAANTWTEWETVSVLNSDNPGYQGFTWLAIASGANIVLDTDIDFCEPYIVEAASEWLIIDGAVKASKLAANSVDATKIVAGSITSNQIAAGAIIGANIASETLTSAHISAGAITSSEIASNAVTAVKVAAGAITAGKIAAGAVTAVKIAAGTITGDKIAANTLTATQIAAGAITSSELAANAVIAGKIAANAVTTANLQARSVDASKIKAGSIGALQLAADKATIDKLWAGGISALTVDAQKLVVTSANLIPGVAGWASGDKTGWEEFGLNTNDAAIWLQGETSQVSSARVTLEPGINYHFSVDVRSSVAGTVYYVALVTLDLSGGVPLSVSSSGYLLQDKIVSKAGVWEPASLSFTVSEPCQARIRIWANRGNEAATTGGYQWFRNLSLRPMVGTTLIEGGAVTTDRIAANAVTAEKITVDQALVNKLAVGSLWAGKISAQMLSATAIDGKTITSATVKSATISGGTITGGTITGATFKTAASGRRLQIDTGGLRFYDSNNNQTAQLDENGLSLTYTTPEGEVQSVGHFFDNSIVGHPEYRGLSIGL
ncbi:MAG: hypothetical protein SPI14_06075, partial [Arcanobacterium sp.]|nr:hypothetical protein [Arcanobacterium sp.]